MNKIGSNANAAGHPVLFGFAPALTFVAHPDGGGYPIGFVEKAYATLNVRDPQRVLHLCSGSMRQGVRIDVRASMRPSVVADCRKTPFASESFRWIMADPPYAETYAEQLYDTKTRYPKPGEILTEAARLLIPGGRFGILHFLVPHARHGLRLVGVWGVSTGCGYAIRAWSVFEKPHASLPLDESEAE